jgi:hypothetical protein
VRTRLNSICFDCARPAALARFWAVVLDYQVRPYDEAEIERLRGLGILDLEDDPHVVIDDPSGQGPSVWFNQVPERKVAKNRVHLDVNVAGQDEIDRLVALGAHVLRPVGAVEGQTWVVMLDPERNEFCAMPAQEVEVARVSEPPA